MIQADSGKTSRIIRVDTSRKVEALDVTERLSEVSHHGALLWVFAPHTTVALTICEADAEMLKDLERVAASLLSPLEPFLHTRNGNPNAAAHLFSSLMGTQLLLPIVDGAVSLGRWQRVMLIELDGPKMRELRIRTLA